MVVHVRRRRFVTLGMALVVAMVVFALQARRRAMYEAEVGLLITEGTFAPDGRPRPRGELRAFLSHEIFTLARLDALIAKHGLVAKLRAGSQDGARTRLRKLIEVETSHDYFEGLRGQADIPRSARVTISFSAPDPDLALEVARDIGEIVADTQTRHVTEIANARVEELRVLAENAAGRALRLEDQLYRARDEAADQTGPISRDLLNQLTAVVQSAEGAARNAAANLVDAELRSHAVHQLKDLVQVVSSSAPLWKTMSRAERMTRQIILALLIGSLAAFLVVGAFDPTIMDEHDLRRAGLTPVGRVTVCRDQSRRPEV